MIALGAVLIGIAVALLAEFPLESLADRSDLAHSVQHGLLFWAGITVGAAVSALYRKGQRRV